MTRSFEDAGKLGKEILDTSLGSLDAVAKDAQAIAAEATDFGRKFFEAGGEALGRLMSATSVEKAVEIQGVYLREAYEGFVAEATKLGALYADLAKGAYRPFEAIVVRSK